MRVPALLALIVVATLPVAAAEKAGVTMPAQITVDGQTLVLNGMGLREVGWIDVYVAGLYLKSRSSDGEAIAGSNETRRIRMEFVRGVSRKKLVKAWDEGFEANAGSDLKALTDRIATFNGWMVDVEKRDTITLTYRAGTGTEVEVKGRNAGTIEGDDFARALFLIWLGADPPTAELRDGMLGLEE
ncbi:MAG: chalcone isomerase family protein [Acidobacteriota bacterium]|nr:chalcone isomerase family protein [Acidobacteriota bacterium]